MRNVKRCGYRLLKVLALMMLVTASLTAWADLPRDIEVFLQGGQSNSDGRALTNGLPADLLAPQTDVAFYYYLAGSRTNADGTLGTLTTLRPGCSAIGNGKTFGPEIEFGRDIADHFARAKKPATNSVLVAIIKYAHGGTSLATRWKANDKNSTEGDGPDYVIFQRVVQDGLARLHAEYPGARIHLEAMTWVQGETDIDGGAKTAAPYGTNLVRFIEDVRLTFATNQPYGTNLPFIFSQISANQTVYSRTNDVAYPDYLLLRAGQAYAAKNLSNVTMVDTDGSQFSTLTPYWSPGLHFDTAGQLALGKALADAFITNQFR
ncbi:MAG TPA: sialate O-acetylesterase [Verrucomicrobiae bacterium]|nr:sialate O-acetylesterase [Verrucomicrobiae bacterium]